LPLSRLVVELKLGSSRALLALFLALYGLTAVVVWLIALPFAARALLFLIVVWHGSKMIRRIALLHSAGSIVHLRQLADGTWLLLRRDGQAVTCKLLERCCFVAPWLVILVFAQGWRQFSVVLSRDALPAEPLRRLRVELGLLRRVV